MSKAKITDEHIRQHLQEGLKQREIADKYDMLPSTLSLRIKKLREKDAREARPTQSIQPMDTVVRLSDRTWFRVKEVNEETAVLYKTMAGEQPEKRQRITVSLDKLTRDFEKKDYAPVKCYIDPALKREKNEEELK